MSEQLHTPEDSSGLEILTHKLSALVFDAATISALNDGLRLPFQQAARYVILAL